MGRKEVFRERMKRNKDKVGNNDRERGEGSGNVEIWDGSEREIGSKLGLDDWNK